MNFDGLEVPSPNLPSWKIPGKPAWNYARHRWNETNLRWQMLSHCGFLGMFHFEVIDNNPYWFQEHEHVEYDILVKLEGL